MLPRSSKRVSLLAFGILLAMTSLVLPSTPINAADHAEAPVVGGDPGADLADVYAFLDPTDNTKVVLALDFEGFIVPSELLNLGGFSPDITYRFEIENTGDVKPDQAIDITFSPQTSRTAPQMATIKLPGGKSFIAPTTVQTQAPNSNPFVVTTDPATNVSFYAGLTDDPFIFDIVGFNRFVAKVIAKDPSAGQELSRSRDSFAGYNIHMVALSVPATMLKGSAGNIIGVNGVTLRAKKVTRLANGEEKGKGGLIQIDRMATPAVNTVLIPFARKNEYNSATPADDAAGKFATDIVNTLKALGTTDPNIDILASVAVAKGDYLRLDTSKANTSLGVGEKVTDASYAGFPNGRRPGDDTVDVLLYFIANQTTVTDNVNVNDLPLNTKFPFFAQPHQPLPSGADCSTQN